ncbi:MAG: SDR family NAD(P)-dependent oxidoreductase, partial [Spirochaetota bacterium]|nr:SDR family NAD(P)-dependent oxidoreductase [Spirochaetota bacterium]
YGPERPSFSVETISCDLSLADGARRLHEECAERGFRVDLLINNAGRGIFGPLIGQDAKELTAMVRLNVESLMLLTRLFAADMTERGDAEEDSFKTGGAGAGSTDRPPDRPPAYILNVGSVAGRMPMPRFAAYGASKSFVREFTVAVRQELRGLRRTAEKRGEYIRPVHVSILEPGYVRTGFDDNAGIESEGYRSFSSKNAMTPRQVAGIGLRGLFAGKPVIVAGFQNRLMIALSRLVPAGTIARIVWNAVSGLIK